MRVLLFLLLIALVGCGGGGGSLPGQTATLVGRVLWIESNAATSPASSISVGSASTATDLIDGSFVIVVPQGASSLTISYSETGSSTPIVRTFTFTSAIGTLDVGDFYIGPDVVTVHGTVIDASDQLPVAGATVKLAGRTATTSASGEFNLLQVAYSFASPAAFGDLVGEVTEINYVTRQFSPPTVVTSGVVEVGALEISPTSFDVPPPLPANVTGTVLPIIDGAGATVELLDGITVIRTTTADGAGQFRFWIGVGNYTVRATNGLKTGTSPLQVTSINVQKVVNVTVS